MRDKTAVGGKSYDLVSDADVQSEQAVASEIRSAFPGHQIVGEEEAAGDVSAADVWIIDPLDGTNNFAHGVPHYAVSIGYYRDGMPTVGAVLNVPTGVLYTAVRGGGATMTTADGVSSPMRCGDQTSLDQVLIGCGFYYDRGEMMRRTLRSIETLFARDIHGIRRYGTASLDLAMVASGMFGAFFEYELSLWDFAAGALLVTEAGGRVSTTQGTGLPMGRTSVLAAGAGVYEAVLEVVGAA